MRLEIARVDQVDATIPEETVLVDAPPGGVFSAPTFPPPSQGLLHFQKAGPHQPRGAGQPSSLQGDDVVPVSVTKCNPKRLVSSGAKTKQFSHSLSG